MVIFKNQRTTGKLLMVANVVGGDGSCRVGMRACCSSRPRFHSCLGVFLGDALGRQRVVGSGRSVSNFTRVTHGSRKRWVIIARSLVTHLEDSEKSTDSLPDFVDGAVFLRVDRIEALDHSLDLGDTVGQLLLLLLEDIDQVGYFVEGTLSFVAVTSMLQDGLVFFRRHEIQRLDASHL
jgi:hypothetical protein